MKLAHKLKQKIKQKLVSQGISDIMVVRWDDGSYNSTPFLVCFGRNGDKSVVELQINGKKIKNTYFYTDHSGYIDPIIPSQQVFKNMDLKYGMNIVTFFNTKTARVLCCQLYLYNQHEKLIISDVDGTLTKSDLKGLAHNIFNKDHIHNGYIQLVEKANKNGYRIVWLTMRSMNLYMFSKRYIHFHTNVMGPLFTEPQQFFSAVKKQIRKDTVQTKMQMLSKIRQIFPRDVNPFAGGLGNRENDALAYIGASIPNQKIFLVDTYSVVKCWGKDIGLDYQHMHKNIQIFFPLINKLLQHSKQIAQGQAEKIVNQNPAIHIQEDCFQKYK